MKRQSIFLLTLIPTLLLMTLVGALMTSRVLAQPTSARAADAAHPMTNDIPLQETGILSGFVTSEADGQPLDEAGVWVYTSTVAEFSSEFMRTTADGFYQFDDLEPGTYYLRFSPSPFEDLHNEEYYEEQETLADADPVTVAAGQPTVINAALQQKPVISGVVTSEATGQPLPGIRVQIIPIETVEDPEIAYNGETDENGAYEFILDEPGSFYMAFQVPSFGTSDFVASHIAEYYNDKPTLEESDPIEAEYNEVTVINPALEQGGTIRGTISAGGEAPPLNTVFVFLYDSNQTIFRDREVFGTGEYDFLALPAGTYYLRVESSNNGYLSEYYDDVFTLADAAPIDVALRMTRTIDITLNRGGSIRGTVTGSDGMPIEDAFVDASLEVVDLAICDVSTDLSYFARTDAQGVYTVTGLITGTYAVDVSVGDVPYVDPAGQTDVVVEVGMNTEVNFSAPLGGEIAGTVTAADSSSGLADVRVTIYRRTTENGESSYRFEGFTRTDDDGTYRVVGLPDGDYVVQFATNSLDADEPTAAYYGEWHSDKDDREAADPVQVTAGNTTTVDEQLARGNRIHGRVTSDVDGAPLRSVEVYILRSQDEALGFTSLSTDANGLYTTTALMPGTYYLFFKQPSFALGEDEKSHGHEFYNDAATLAAATPVVVSAGADVKDVDVSLPLGGAIQGTVSTDRGSAFTGVKLYDSSGYEIDLDSSLGGFYSFNGLRPGTYYVEFEDDSVRTGCQTFTPYEGSFYDDKPDLASATPVVVTAEETVTDIDGTLVEGEIEPQPSSGTLHLPHVVR